jgi:hypothetical protein
MESNGKSQIELGRYPTDEGWNWLYRFYDLFIRPNRLLRLAVRAYFWPKRFELARWSIFYRVLGV